MEPLEIRIARLTPEQQQEVGDFVDFLLLKNNLRNGPAHSVASTALMSAPPVMTMEPVPPLPAAPVPADRKSPVIIPPAPVIHAEETASPVSEIVTGGDDGITRDYMDYGQFDTAPSPATEAVRKVRQKILVKQKEETTGHLLEWVD
ncbi:MAG: hypothetical protein GYA23_09205 [Methanomicrobiales archaeon]|nr:hypothetical protein [Methanomicrobiales archaeon]